MGLSSGFEANSIGGFGAGVGGFPTAFAGGFGGGWGGGFGGIAPIGLVGLNNLFDRDRGRRGNDDDCCDSNRNLAVLAAIGNAKDQTVDEGRAAAAAFALTNDNIKDAQYAAAIQAERNTAQLAQQAQAFQIQTEKSIDALAAAGVAQTASILARLNQAEVDRLRDELHETRRGRDLDIIRIENNNTNSNVNAQFQAQAQAQLQAQLDEHRRRWDNREIEINNINTNTAVATQLQQQQQQQAIRDLDRDHRWNNRFDALFSQQNKVAQDIVNIGGTVGANQTSTPTNNTVNK